MEQEEEKNIIIEFQRKVLQEANCTAEMLAYLDEIDDDVFREYYCICALDGMTVEEIRRIDSIAVQDWRVKIKHIKEERLNFLENIFVPNSEMQKQISELHDKAGKVFQETEELRITLNATLQQTLDIQKNALTEQRESYQNSLAAKEELIKERDEKIQSLVNEIEQNKKTWQTEKKTLLLQLEEKKSSDDDKEEQKEVPSKKENSVRDVTEKKKRWHFFCKENKKRGTQDNNNEFIETYLAKDTFNDAQKEFLIQCLEEGDSVQEMKNYASASLTPAMMQRLRQVRKKRRERP